MTVIRLVTASGELVTEAYIPPFKSLPAVVVWGTRTFQFDADDTFQDDAGGRKDWKPAYRECFTYWIPPGMEKVMA